MSDWKMTDKSKSDSIIEAAIEVVSGGLSPRPYDYEFTNKQTGEVVHTKAYNDTQAGEHIRDGLVRH